MSELLTIGKAADLLGVSIITLRNWTNDGRIECVNTLGNHRRYKKEVIEALIGTINNSNTVCCYCRVSSSDQKQHGDLERQKERLLEYCKKKKYKVGFVLEECCSGMKATRPKLNQLYKLVTEKQINKVVVEHKDRLTRFMFEVFEVFFKSYGVEIEFVEEVLPKSFENELVEDIISLMTSFTARLHSRRKKQSKEAKKKNGN